MATVKVNYTNTLIRTENMIDFKGRPSSIYTYHSMYQPNMTLCRKINYSRAYRIQI
jgi:hypothetical protein